MDDIHAKTLSQFAKKCEKEAKMWKGHEDGPSNFYSTKC